MSTLPQPRQFLTSLLTSISTIPAPPNSTTDPPTNPLKALSTPDRALLSTLHVLFPSSILLPALDLLDRGLVTRLDFTNHPEPATPEPSSSSLEQASTPSQPLTTIYQVRSSQTTRPRSHSTAPLYSVHVKAWNCSCAAFTFAAFPGTGGLFKVARREVTGDGKDRERDGDVESQFGCLSLDGVDGGEVPCCKHLLACVLAERWVVLSAYVKVRSVGMGEMAGVTGES